MSPVTSIIIVTIVFFAFQLALCVKTRRGVVKGIPLYLIIVSFLLSAACYAGLFGTASAGALAAHELVGLFLAMYTAFALLGVIAAWVIYWVWKLFRRRTTL